MYVHVNALMETRNQASWTLLYMIIISYISLQSQKLNCLLNNCDKSPFNFLLASCCAQIHRQPSHNQNQ